jgi:hypothetical protein
MTYASGARLTGRGAEFARAHLRTARQLRLLNWPQAARAELELAAIVRRTFTTYTRWEES